MAPPRRIHDRALLDALDGLSRETFTGTAWRVTWATRDPLLGNAAGGRWHPPDSFEALYSSLEADGALAEAYYHLSRAPVFSSSSVRLAQIAVRTRQTLRLPDMASLVPLGVEETRYASLNYERCQEIGAAAHLLEFDSLIAPSARAPYLNLVLFMDRIDVEQALRVEQLSEVNWPAWKATQQ